VISDGLIVVKNKTPDSQGLKRIRQAEASHPTPDERGVAAAHEILALAGAASEQTLVVCLLSGGGSALLVAPVEGVSLRDKQATTELLLRSGASIAEVNAVRKHLSAVKGGRLAQRCHPAAVLTLIMSDVIGDRIDVIASGPTAPDNSTFADAWAVVRKYGLQEILPHPVAGLIQRGLAGLMPETLRAGDPCLSNTANVIVAGLSKALGQAQRRAMELGLQAEIVTSELQGEASDAAARLARAAQAEREALPQGARRCLLFGGETVVTVRGRGKGGRNQELALAFACQVDGVRGIKLLSAGTDGIDGPTDAAGAVVDGETLERARAVGLDAHSYLRRNDSYNFFREFDAATGEGAHIITGPTATNVMDIQILLLEGY
jgi:glycerate-2-kinase